MDEMREFSYTDIGPNTISFLAAGLYPDARDPIREHIQNAVDAQATETSITILEDSIVIENNGAGMDSDDIWDSLRIAISDKDPDKHVGYKGIGFYSGLLIARRMIIKSRKNNACVQLILDFDSMRQIIKQKRPFPDVINDSVEVIALPDFNFLHEDLSGDGTQVELAGIRKEFKEYYTDSELSNYLTNSLPLTFDPEFCYAEQINQKIQEVCSQTGYEYRSVNLQLMTPTANRALHRPYKFNENQVFEPHFEIVNVSAGTEEKILALVWGCLNKKRKVIAEKHHRGFRFRLKGFAVGDAHTTLPYFSRGTTHSNRYIGEIVIFSNLIQSNTARSDLAHTEYYPKFKKQLKTAIENFQNKSNVFQESSVAGEECDKTESNLAIQMQSPTWDGVHKLKGNLESLKNRLKQPLDNSSKERVEQIIDKLKTEIPKLESTLRAQEKGGSSDSANGEGQSETDDNSGEKDTEDTEKQQKKKAGLRRNAQVVEILSALNTTTEGAAQIRKIQQLYDSLTTISVNKHACLMHIGTWTLWEIIAKSHGIGDSRNIKNHLKTFAAKFSDRTDNGIKKADYANALDYIHTEGNMNKHSDTAVAEDGLMLRNKMEVLDAVLLEIVKEIYEKHASSDWQN